MRILHTASNRNNNISFNMYLQQDTELILFRSSNKNNSIQCLYGYKTQLFLHRNVELSSLLYDAKGLPHVQYWRCKPNLILNCIFYNICQPLFYNILHNITSHNTRFLIVNRISICVLGATTCIQCGTNIILDLVALAPLIAL